MPNMNLQKNYFPESRHLLTVLNQQIIDNLTTRLLREKNWVAHVNQNAYQGDWDVIPLRCIREHQLAHSILQCFSHEGSNKEMDWVYLPLISQYSEIKRVLDNLHCPIKSVRFMRLRSGAKILPHKDRGVSLAHGEARLHIPISSSSDVSFFVAKKRVSMKPGELWYIDANQEHSVENNGKNDRIHLIIDCISNNWLRSLVVKEKANQNKIPRNQI